MANFRKISLDMAKLPSLTKRFDQKLHEAQKQHLVDFRLLVSCAINLGLLIAFFVFGIVGFLYFLLPCAILVGLAVCIGLTFQRISWLPAVKSQIILCILFAGLEILLLLISGYLRDETALDACLHQQVRIEAEVASTKPVGGGSSMFQLDVTEISCASTSFPLSRKITGFAYEPLIHGSQVKVQGKLIKDKGSLHLKNPIFNEQTGSQPPSLSDKIKLKTKHVTEKHLSKDQTALLLGLAYGDDSSMQKPTKEEFKVAGLTHLTAVSGSNITLIFIMVFRFGQYIYVRRRPLIVAATLATFFYAQLVGWEGSVIRAWCMGMVGAIALIIGSGKSTLPIYSSAVLFLLFFDPELSINFGFLLSVVATASLILLAPPLSRSFGAVFPPLLADIIAIPIAASIWTTPVVIIMTGKVSTFTVLANILAVPLVAPITILGLMVLAISVSNLESLVQLYLVPAQWLTQILLSIAGWISSLPASSFEYPANPATILWIVILCLGFSSLIIYLDRKLTSYLLDPVTVVRSND